MRFVSAKSLSAIAQSLENGNRNSRAIMMVDPDGASEIVTSDDAESDCELIFPEIMETKDGATFPTEKIQKGRMTRQ
jgi:hypothetical protein